MNHALDKNKMIYSIDELKNMKLSYYAIQKLIENKILKKLTKKHYENLSFSDTFNDYVYVNAYVPKGVICLMSAVSYYGLTTVMPQEVDIAIFREDKASTLPDWPSAHLYYFSKDRYHLGVKTIKINHDSFRIYDIDKTVADIISYREKIGILETKEILKKYLESKDKNLNNLMRYAKKLGCYEIIKTYMEVLL